MTQSADTVTPPNPTPPTNFSSTGTTAPNPPNYTKATYADPVASPPPFYDDGSAGTLTDIATNKAALASGVGADGGGTEGSYPVKGGVVPASTSVAAEGDGTETVVTAPGSRTECPTQSVSVLGSFTSSPNSQHASSLSPATNPALASIAPTSAASGASGTDTITFTGTNFTKQSVVYADGVALATTYVSPTSLTAAVPKKTSAGTKTLNVLTGGAVVTVDKTLTYT